MSKRSTHRPRSQTTASGKFTVVCCPDGHVHIDVSTIDHTPAELVFEPDDAYAFAQAILRGYDEATGIA